MHGIDWVVALGAASGWTALIFRGISWVVGKKIEEHMKREERNLLFNTLTLEWLAGALQVVAQNQGVMIAPRPVMPPAEGALGG